MSYTLLLIDTIKIFQCGEYINLEKFNEEEFKAYHGFMVEVLSDLAYIYYSYFEDYIITGNSEITVEFIILPDFFEVNRET